MLSDLSDLQDSGESVRHIDMKFEIDTRSEEGSELVHKEYTFSYARQFDTWTFQEYREERTPDTNRMADRNWTRSRHIVWQDINETRTIDVPPEVADALAEATDSESVSIQVPQGGFNEREYDTIKTV